MRIGRVSEVEARAVLATHNAHKVAELRAILAPVIAGWRDEWLVGAADMGVDSPVEDGATFEENALLKARAASRATGLVAIADDSGISVDILGGAPGIFSARGCGRHGDDAANLRLLLDQLADVPDRLRGAQFVSAAALVTPDGEEVCELGCLRGVLTHAPRGNGGFGYDPIFVPEGSQVTTAEMSAERKNSLSHRGRAFRALAPALARYLAAG